MSDCLAWGDSFYSGSYFCCATSMEAVSVLVRSILPHMALGSCLEGQSTTLNLVNIIVLPLKPMQACCTAEWGLWLLLRSVRAPTGWLGWRAGICHALSKETWHPPAPHLLGNWPDLQTAQWGNQDVIRIIHLGRSCCCLPWNCCVCSCPRCVLLCKGYQSNHSLTCWRICIWQSATSQLSWV